MMSQRQTVGSRDDYLGCLGGPPLDQCIVGQRQAVVPYLGFLQLAGSCISINPPGRYGGEWDATVLMFFAEMTERLLQF